MSENPALVARLSGPMSINGLKRALKAVKERYGSNVQVVPVPGAIEFVYGGVPNKGQNPHRAHE